MEEIKEDPTNDNIDTEQPEIIQDIDDNDDSNDDDDGDDSKQQHVLQRTNTLTELRNTVKHSWISLKRGISHLNPTAYLKSEV